MTKKKQIMKVDDGAYGNKFISVDFPSNSHNTREQIGEKGESEKKVDKIVTGKVMTKKKPLSKKMSELLFGDNITNVSQYLIYDVIVPAAKNTISDLVTGGIDILLYGERRNPRARRSKGKSYISYSNYYNDSRGRRDESYRRRARHSFDDIILESRGEAEDVLSHLVELTETYGMASVADFYDLVGVTGSFTDNKYGWDNLASSRVIRVRDGYLIELPPTMLLE